MEFIKQWTTALRYKPYQDWSKSYRKGLEEAVQASKWKLAYHIQPKSGLLNDPNGFSFYDGKWHLFYQAYPFGPVHGVKSWYHLTSANLVDWRRQGFALLPDTSYDSHGVYSGSALPVEDQLFLMYTGNVRNQEWERHSYQLGAWMNQAGQVEKLDAPLIVNPPTDYTHEFRDPQVFRYQGDYYMIIGAQTSDEKGAVLLYKGTPLTDWEWIGELHFTDEEMGFMVECPNLVFVDQQPVLLFCPQGLDTEIASYQNIFPNMYVIGSSFAADEGTITETSSLKNLDEGFDVYATQAFNAPDGRALSVSWVGLPEVEYPSFAEGWAHCLSLVKELQIKDGHLYQTPVQELQQLRQRHQTLRGHLQEEACQLAAIMNNRYELKLELTTDASGQLILFADEQNQQGLTLSFDAKNGTIIMDRSKAGIAFGEAYGITRTAHVPQQTKLTLHIFVDESVCEVFINDGYQVMTSRVFPHEEQTYMYIQGANGDYHGDIWSLRSMKN
ncbi:MULTISPECIES: sucrose-6-phosphate hydrolase [Gracilibacillus]|uniref:sucrose-6-phosphate hydrolase n=1 Tax=Gracilibacillus TaxID=74385 RepID=UPI000825BB6D|nr:MULTISPECIES: sucrose-6-phosphate hydrolase [Gracilibacillus]